MANRNWSDLPAGAKKFYTDQGITAGPYNRWWRTPQAERTALTAKAKAAGYDSGLQFMAAQAQVRQQTGTRINVTTKPREAARRLLHGAKRSTPGGRYRYRQAARLFHMEDWDHLEWTEFMSP